MGCSPGAGRKYLPQGILGYFSLFLCFQEVYMLAGATGGGEAESRKQERPELDTHRLTHSSEEEDSQLYSETHTLRALI